MRDALGTIRTVLLLGGTSEIGLTIVRRLIAERGARQVILAGRDLGAMQRSAADLAAVGPVDVSVTGFDALEVDAHPAVVEELWQSHGDVDVVVAAFGQLGDQAAAEQDVARALEVVRTNYVGAVSALMAVGERLERQGHGSLVVLSSVAGDRGRRANYVYGSSKAGLDVFAQGLGDRLHAAGAHVLVVRPGFVHTRMTAGLPAAPFATTPDVVADAVLDGLDRRQATVYAPPILRLVMAVLKTLPRAVFRLLPG